MPENDLSQKAQAVICLARGYSTDKTGDAIGVNGRTIRRWREDPTFESEVQTARRAILTEAVAALGAAARDAVDVLHDALTDPAAGIRVRAAATLLAALPSIAEHAELDARIAALEAAAERSTT